MNEQCIVCSKRQTDRAHVKSRGAGGDWSQENIVPLCRHHHQVQHYLGWPEFVARYPQAELALEAKGWAVQEVLGQRRLVRTR